ncbi:MAG: zinc ribbon domain-containing protein [bacterium]|nr:zinc ribbon domain-containing protein [bacterium]
MNCPRCTKEIPDGGKFCPACGLDLELINEEPFQQEANTEATDFSVADESEFSEPASQSAEESFWTGFLEIRESRNFKRPYLAATIAFFFGPFTYLYLEQMNWFWVALLGGLTLAILTQLSVVPLLMIGGMLHSFDIAQTMNGRRSEFGYE